MFVKDKEECKEFVSLDKAKLREILHPKNDPIDLGFSVAYAKIKPGDETIAHKLEATEVYYILRGQGMMYVNEESKEVREGCAIYIPPNSVQHIKNTADNDLEFICIVEPPWNSENDEIV